MAGIGEMIRAKRLEKKLTQTALAVSVGCDTSTISRIEKNQVTNPQILQGIFELFELDKAVLTAADLRYDTLKIGFGHCIWATPVINMLLNARLNHIKFTSFGFNDYEPQFLDKDNLYMLPGFVDCFNGPNEAYFENRQVYAWERTDSFRERFRNNAAAATDIKSYDASDLLNLLKYDELDGVVIPGDLYYDNVEFVDRAASIIYTAEGGCELCVIHREDDGRLADFFGAAPTDPGSLLAALRASVADNVLSIFYAEDTIADKYLERYLMNELKAFPSIDYIPVDVGNWQHFWTDTIKPILTAGNGRQKVCLFLGWQPQTLWLKQSLRNEDTGFCLRQVEFRRLFREQRLNYFSFDVLFNRKGKWRNKEITQDFFRYLNSSITDLNVLIRKLSYLQFGDDPSSNEQLLKKYKEIVGCSKYLNMNMQDFLYSITQLNFDLKFYHEWTYPISQ